MLRSEAPPVLSVIVPARNEQETIHQLVKEVVAALADRPGGFEIVVVDDGSTDATARRLETLIGAEPRLRGVHLRGSPSGQPLGQSAALLAGVRVARGRVIAMLDADLQNPPGELPRLLRLLEATGADMVQGDRSRARQDRVGRRVGSFIGRLTRRLLLGDTIRDTGCSLRVMRRAVAVALPLEFRGMHRFVPVIARSLGFRVVEVPVDHRPRRAGRTKYGLWNRALPGLVDCLAVRWMTRRRQPIEWDALEAFHEPDASPRRGPTALAVLACADPELSRS